MSIHCGKCFKDFYILSILIVPHPQNLYLTTPQGGLGTETYLSFIGLFVLRFSNYVTETQSMVTVLILQCALKGSA